MPKALLTLLGAWLTHATWASMDNTSRSSSTKPGGACDSVPEASIGWVATLAGDARDHRDWWQQKDVAPPAVYRARQQKKRTPE